MDGELLLEPAETLRQTFFPLHAPDNARRVRALANLADLLGCLVAHFVGGSGPGALPSATCPRNVIAGLSIRREFTGPPYCAHAGLALGVFRSLFPGLDLAGGVLTTDTFPASFSSIPQDSVAVTKPRATVYIPRTCLERNARLPRFAAAALSPRLTAR
jgi:hypothetical protein